MKNKKTIIIVVLILIDIIVWGIYFQKRNSYYYSLSNMQKKIKYYNRVASYLHSKSKIEGHYIWDTGILTKKQFNDISLRIKFPKLVFWYDSLGCSQCYLDQLINIKNRIGMKNTIILYNGRYTFLKLDFSKYYFVNAKNGKKLYKQLVALVSQSGRIIYAFFPQYGLGKETPYFYNQVENYLMTF
jgi:hypothetical protein